MRVPRAYCTCSMASLMHFAKLDKPLQGYHAIINISMCAICARKHELLEFSRYLGILDELSVLSKKLLPFLVIIFRQGVTEKQC